MACTDPNCNTQCSCNSCCPPTPPPTPPTPPTCEGTDCVEIYDAACVNYTGPDITCMSIATDTNINSIIQTLANNICICCDKIECISPLKLLFERLRLTYDALKIENNTTSIATVLQNLMNLGIVTKKCKYCCPDSGFWSLSLSACTTVPTFETFYDIPCTNCWTNNDTCSTTLLTLFDITFGGTEPALTTASICEYGGFNNVSGICELNKILSQSFSYAEITDIMDQLNKEPLVILCDLKNANIVIGNTNLCLNYLD